MSNKYPQGKHPKSLANLTSHVGRPIAYKAKKKSRCVTVTDEGWEKLNNLIDKVNCQSVSELLEKLAREEIEIGKQPC